MDENPTFILSSQDVCAAELEWMCRSNIFTLPGTKEIGGGSLVCWNSKKASEPDGISGGVISRTCYSANLA